MLKKYKSKSCVSLSVVLPTGGTTHISFSPVTGSGSVFYTENEKLQAGLESHPKFGKLFSLDSQPVVSAKPAAKSKAKAADTASDGKNQLKEMEMSCNDDAKDYLVEKFGISRTKLRSREQIESAGIANGIKFIWA